MDSDSPVEMPKVEKMVHSQAMPGHWNGVGARFWCSHCMEETHTHRKYSTTASKSLTTKYAFHNIVDLGH